MPERSVKPVAPDPSSQPAANDRKRKRRGSTTNHPQKTISELFTATENKARLENGKAVHGEDIPEKKRRKQPPPSPMKPSILPISKMYSFSGQQPNGHVIDLTGSPDGTPPRRLPRPMNNAAGPRKLVVKNLRTVPKTDPTVYFEKQWEKLSIALDTIFSGGEILPYSYEEIYQSVQNVCKQGRAEALTGRFMEKASEAITDNAEALSKAAADGKSPIQILELVDHAWNSWNKQFVSEPYAQLMTAVC